MCGFTGILNYSKNVKITHEYLLRLSVPIAHRGPDDYGDYISPDNLYGSAHRRLSILDLSPEAKQPMLSPDGNVVLAFNGEIYNYMEIKAELEKSDNISWRTKNSDSEVVLHAYLRWGIDCIKRFNGMFAISIYDERVKKLYLARDRFGIKPLYWSDFSGRVVFGSEVKAILGDPDFKKSPNKESFIDFFVYNSVPAPYTMFENIHKLEASTFIEFSSDGTRKQFTYYNPLEHLIETGSDENRIQDEIYSRLEKSIAYRCLSDRPHGVMLSGGLDSSLLLGIYAQKFSHAKTFTIGYEGSPNNENVYAKKVSDKFETNNFERMLSEQDFFDTIDEIIYQQDDPISDPVVFPFFHLSKLTRENDVVVALGGEGSDELFWGYNSWKIYYNLQKMIKRFPRAVAKLPYLAFSLNKVKNKKQLMLLERHLKGQPIFQSGAEQVVLSDFARYSGNTLNSEMRDYDAFSKVEKHWNDFSAAGGKGTLNWMTYMSMKLRLPELLLMRTDKMSMRFALEVRVPFLDHNLVEYALSIPENIKVKNAVTKYILKKTAERVLPDEIIYRKKQGFTFPVMDYMKSRLPEVTQTINKFASDYGYINNRAALAASDEGNYEHLWVMFYISKWFDKYFG